MAWNSKTFVNILHEIKRTKARIGGIQKILDNINDSHLLALEGSLQKHLKQLLDNEESIWQMKSRLQWLTLGDRNTSFHTTDLNKEDEIKYCKYKNLTRPRSQIKKRLKNNS